MMHPSEESPITGSDYNLSYRMMGNDDKGRNANGNVALIPFLKDLIASAKENHSIELLMFFHMIGYTCTTVIVQNLYIDRICRIEHNFDPELCQNLTKNPDQEKLVEQDAAVYNMYR